jgi:site-specific DNA-adenine methylase
MFKFLFLLILTFMVLRGVFAFLFRFLNTGRFNSQQGRTKQRPTQPKQPESQEERIIDYQKKSFESTEVEDADYIEIKDHE